MTTEEFIALMNSGEVLPAGTEGHRKMTELSQEAIRITMDLNSNYHTPEEVRSLMEELTGRPVPESFNLFPPFYTDCGKNLVIGENVFFNSGCKFQDQGGISIGDGCLIGHNAVIATINHSMDPDHRGDMSFAPVKLGKNVWLGANVTITPGITVGDGAVVAAGAVVTKDVPAGAVVAGVPAKVIRYIDE